jgi:CRP-like cAMP-binding protein
VLSVLRQVNDGRCIEAYPVGRDALLGIPELLGASGTSTRTARGAVASECSSVSLATLRALMPELPRFAELRPRMAVVLLEQSQQVLACNGLHSVEHRCARWLLMTHDRVGDEFGQTHDALAQLLAVRRASVTVSMAAFQKARLIASRRGHIRIEDGAGLEMAACECYTAVRASALDRLSDRSTTLT